MFKLNKSHSKYTKYKATNIEWIGDFPDGWEVKKLKYVADIIMGQSPDGESVNDEGHGIPFFQGKTEFGDLYPIPKKWCVEPKKLAKINDILISVRAPVGDLNISNTNCCIGRGLAVIRNDNYKFIYYALFTQHSQLNSFNTGSTFEAIGSDVLANVIIANPSLQDQQFITSYLDEKTALLDKAITRKQKQIELLSEHRTALINDAITKGLDKNVELKNSGVEWIGMIPKEWEVKPLFSEVGENKIKNEGNINNNLLSLSYGKIINKDIENNFGLLPESFENYQIVEEGMIILRLTDLQNDKKSLRVGYVREKGIITSAYTGLVVKSGISPVFLYQLLHSYDLQKVFYRLGGGVRQGMNYNDLKRLPILVPPLNEQTKITNYLDKETKYIDAMIVKLKLSIELLNEYKTSLIYHAVSGKIKVV